MRKFLKGRWHNIPIGIVSALLILVLVAGSAFAAYTVWSGSAEVTVEECFTVSYWDGDSWETLPNGNEWPVSLKPGEAEILNVRVSNSSTATLPITLSATEAYASIDATWSPSSGSIAGSSFYDFTLTVTATDSATPGEYTVDLNIARGS